MQSGTPAVHGQAALLLRHDVPSYYVSRELLAAALRTELPDDMVFDAIPFPFDALVVSSFGRICGLLSSANRWT